MQLEVVRLKINTQKWGELNLCDSGEEQEMFTRTIPNALEVTRFWAKIIHIIIITPACGYVPPSLSNIFLFMI